MKFLKLFIPLLAVSILVLSGCSHSSGSGSSSSNTSSVSGSAQ